jgi:hypothetical protein
MGRTSDRRPGPRDCDNRRKLQGHALDGAAGQCLDPPAACAGKLPDLRLRGLANGRPHAQYRCERNLHGRRHRHPDTLGNSTLIVNSTANGNSELIGNSEPLRQCAGDSRGLGIGFSAGRF